MKTVTTFLVLVSVWYHSFFLQALKPATHELKIQEKKLYSAIMGNDIRAMHEAVEHNPAWKTLIEISACYQIGPQGTLADLVHLVYLRGYPFSRHEEYVWTDYLILKRLLRRDHIFNNGMSLTTWAHSFSTPLTRMTLIEKIQRLSEK